MDAGIAELAPGTYRMGTEWVTATTSTLFAGLMCQRLQTTKAALPREAAAPAEQQVLADDRHDAERPSDS